MRKHIRSVTKKCHKEVSQNPKIPYVSHNFQFQIQIKPTCITSQDSRTQDDAGLAWMQPGQLIADMDHVEKNSGHHMSFQKFCRDIVSLEIAYMTVAGNQLLQNWELYINETWQFFLYFVLEKSLLNLLWLWL